MEIVCSDCPRLCSAVRTEAAGRGACRMGLDPVLARAAAHMWEEPCISGTKGSGAVFFSGCSLNCIFCQNREISREGKGKAVTPERLRDIYFELIAGGVHNINLVNPSHFSRTILRSLQGGLPVPVVYNTGGYDLPETLRLFEGRIQIYLPDMKYALREPALKYSRAADYPERAKAAITEMFRQTGPYKMGDDGILKSGVLIRHLILPDNIENTFRVIDWVEETFSPGDVLFSLMSQFTPMDDGGYPELSRPITPEEHERCVNYLMDSHIEDGFFQELEASDSRFIPEFDMRGI